MTKDFYIIFGAQMVNKGAQAMLFVTISEIRKRDPKAKIIVFIYDGWKSLESPDMYNVTFVPITMKHIMNLSGTLLGYTYILGKRAKISSKSSELAMIDYILKHAKMAIDISGYAFSNQWGVGSSVFYLSKFALFHKYGIQTYVLPQSFGPFDYGNKWKNTIVHSLAKKYLQYPEMIYARESEGFECLKKEFKLQNVRLSQDLVLQSKSVNLDYIYKNKPVFRKYSVKSNSVAIIPNFSNNKYGDSEQLFCLYEKIITQLQEMNKNIYLLSHSRQDLQLCKDILKNCKKTENIVLIEEDLNCIEYGMFIKNFDYLIASRFHSIVNAYKELVPCISLGWATKYKELLSQLGQQQFSFDVRDINHFDSILNAILELEKTHTIQSMTIKQNLKEIQNETCFQFLDVISNESVEKENNVSVVADEQLCVGCGICKSVCPLGCIEYRRHKGSYIPIVEKQSCIGCGKCLKICPGKGFDYVKEWNNDVPNNKFVGGFLETYSAYSKDTELLKTSTSGGCVTEVIKYGLASGMYEAAFCVETSAYDQMVNSKCIMHEEELGSTMKSRYVPIAHTAAISYIINNPEKKIIFVGTSCAIHGLLNVIREYGLNRKNYLLLGLFCDRTLNYNVVDYFSKEYCNGQLETMYFRDKGKEGWPGNLTFYMKDGNKKRVSSSARTDVKDYFQLSGCLYCYDKLNQFADISFGDDYGNKEQSKACNGRNSVIVRTNLGREIWENVSSNINVELQTIEEIEKAQSIYLKKKNNTYTILNSSVYNENTGFFQLAYDQSAIKEYEQRKAKIVLGNNQDYEKIKIEVKKQKSIRILKRIKRKLGKLIRG